MYKGQIINVVTEKTAERQSNEKTTVRKKKRQIQTCTNTCTKHMKAPKIQ